MAKHRRDCVRVLLAGASASDAKLSCGSLQDYRRQAFEVERVDCLAEAISLAAKGPFDAAVLDLNLPDSRGLEACVKMRQAAPDMPIVVLADADEEPVALEAIHQGIQDYVIEGPTAGETLGRALYYAVERRRAQHALQDAQERLQAQTEEVHAQTEELRTQTEELAAANQELRENEQRLEAARTAAENERRRLEAMMQALPVGVAITNTQGGNIQSNDAFERVWGGPRPAAQSVSDYAAYRAWWADTGKAVAPEEWASAQVVQTGEPVIGQMMEIQRFDGSRAFVINSAAPVRDATGEVVGSAVALQDISVLREAESRLAYLASFPLRNPSPVMEVDANGDIRYMNPAAMRLFPDLAEQGLLHPWLSHWATVVGPFREGQTDTGIRDLTIGERTYLQAFYYSPDDRFVRIYGSDITDRERAERALQEANERLQTQAEELRAANEELQAQQEELQSQAQELREAEQALRPLNEELEQRVTERTEDLSKANEALRQAGAYNRSLLEASLDPLVTIGPDGKITDVNAATETVTGYTRKKLIGTDFSDYFTEPEKAQAGYQQVFQKGFVRDYPLRIRHKKGRVTEVLYNAAVYRDGAGNTAGVFAAARDVTDLRRAEQAVRAERQRFQKVLDQLPAYLVLLSPDYRVPFANRFFEQRFGKSEGRRCYEYLFHRTESCENCETFKVLKTNASHRWEWTGPDGRNYDIYDFPFTDVDDSALIMEVGLDITERKRAEVELAKHREHLEELVQQRTSQLEAANEELRGQEQALQESLETQSRMAERLKLLSDTAASLLAADEPQGVVEALCRKVMEFLDCQVFFNFLVDEQAGRLRLNACAGIPKKERKKIEWLDFGVAVCGCAARDGKRIVAEHISETGDPRTDLVKSYGIKAYACHPIMAGTQVLGTLSFGTRTREIFAEDELSLMKAVTDMVAIAVQRQQVQQALRDSEERLERAQKIAHLGSWELDLVNNRLTWSDEVYRIFGLVPQEFGATYEAFLERVHPDDRAAVDGAYSGSLRENRDAYEIEHRVVRRNAGEIRVVHEKCEHFRDATGKIIRSVGMVHDITERKQMEAQLRQLNEQLEEKVGRRTEQLTATVDRLQDEVVRRVLAEGKLRKNSQMLEGFFQHTIAPLAFLDRHFNFVRVNEAYAKADGKDPQYFVGKDHFRLYPDDENRAIFEQVVRTKQAYRAYAKPFIYPDDPQRMTLWNWQLTPLLNDAGEVQSLVLNLQDVTEQQRAYQELEQRTHQLQHLALDLSQAEDRERKRLAEILHDDLQQILAAAKFHLGILNSRIKTDRSLREMAVQVNQLLGEAIDKSRSLSHELSPAVLYQGDLGETFEWLAQQLQAKHGLTVHVETHGRVDSQSEALKAFLYRSAQEMLFNVVKHARAREARLRVKRARGRLWLSIADHGQGFDPKALGKAAGFGLLSIRERVGLLGGRMKIRSAPSRGSTFLITVPDPQETKMATQAAQASLHAAAEKRKHTEPKSPERLRVLLVDDHKVMREGLATLLNEQPDMEVVGQAGNGREAVDLAHKLLPDVVIMDASMPVMPGDEATRQIKLHLPKIRVIGLSMFDEPQMSRKMRRAGAEAYLLKTAPSDELLAAIRGKQQAE